MKLTPRQINAMRVLSRSATTGWDLGWGTVQALRRRGLVVDCKRPDFVRLTPEGRELARKLFQPDDAENMR